MSHFILSKTDLSALAKHHYHVSPDGKRVEERWAPEPEMNADDCYEALRPALLEALYRPKKQQTARLAEIETALQQQSYFMRLRPRMRKVREALISERDGIWGRQKASDNLLRKLSQDTDTASDEQIKGFAHIFGVDVEIALWSHELQFSGEFLEAGTNLHTVSDSLGEVALRSYKVTQHRILLSDKGHKIMHLCEAQGGGRRGLMIDSSHVPGLRAKQSHEDNAGVFFSKDAALTQARKIHALRQQALDRLTLEIGMFSGEGNSEKAEVSVGRLRPAAA